MRKILFVALACFTMQAMAQTAPPGATAYPGGWCRVYTLNTAAQFQELLAQQVAAGHWIVSATPIRGADSQMQYVVAVCSSKPAHQ